MLETPLENPEGGENGDRNSAATRWPREETMALLKIRSDMDVAFKDTNPKAPLWEQVSRKLAELGYQRSAKKCKEKFENIYKYHRRTKEGRCSKPNGTKTYRFFEQLEALDGHQSLPCSEEVTVKSTTGPAATTDVPDNNVSAHVLGHSSSTTSCSEKGLKKRKLTQFLEGLMREVIEKQETLQNKFMEVLDKCERDRMAREEAWKKDELARIKKERELLAQERSIAAAKDEAVLAFLRKFAETEGTVQLLEKIQVQNDRDKDKDKDKDMQQVVNVRNFVHMSNSRWPKDEVEDLIRLRTQLEVQSQGNINGSKGPLWEEISSAMKSLGYDRSAKRCKEKWENINKYFKRMKEKNKRKPQDSKTCPYYHHLEALYSKRPKKVDESGGGANNSGNELKPEELLMHIMESQEEKQQLQIENTDQNQGDRDNEDESGYQMVANSPSVAIMS